MEENSIQMSEGLKVEKHRKCMEITVPLDSIVGDLVGTYEK